MARWEVRTLSEVCTFKPTKAEARAKLSEDNEVSFAPMEDLGIGVKYLQPHRTRKLGEVSGSYTYFADGDVLLAKITPCFENGKLGVARGLTNGVGFGSSEYIVLRPNASLGAEFLYYYLARPVFLEEGARHMAGAVGHKRVTKEFVESYPIPLPPLPEQQRIVAILDEAFEDIATAKANAEKNLRNSRELFDGALQTVFANQESRWETKSVGEWVNEGVLAKPQDGNHGEIHPTKADYVESGIPFVMAADLVGGSVDTVGCRFIDEAQARSLRIGFARSGDVLLSHKGTIGRVAILETDLEFVVLTPQVTYYRPLKPDRLCREFLYFCMMNPSFQSQVSAIAGAGSTRAYIGITRQLDLKIALPQLPEQVALASRLRKVQRAVNTLAETYVRKLTALDELKRSLLHQAFSGQL
jgi:type I restriction enzyme S subunit